MPSLAALCHPLLPLVLTMAVLTMALAGAARADGDQPAPAQTDVALQQAGSSLPPRAAADPARADMPPQPHPFAAAKPDDERMFMLMLFSRTTIGTFGRLGQ
jgi:hypothetical protein